MSLNKFTKMAEKHDWMNINCETLVCNGSEFHESGNVKIKTQDNLGYNNFSTLTMGAPNQVLETDSQGNLSWVDQSGGNSDPDTIARIQNIKLPETTVGNTQIDGNCVLDTVTANTLTLNGNNVETDISALQQKTTDISYTTNLTTITNSALVTSNLQVNGELQVIADDLNTLSIKPSTLGTAGQALLSDASGDVDFGDVVQNPVQSTINMQDNAITNLVAPSLSSDAATKGYVDGIETTLSGQISTNTSNITTNTSNIATNTSDIATKASISDATTSTSTTWSSTKIANEIAGGGGGGSGDIALFRAISCDIPSTANSWDWYLNEIITQDITISGIRLSPSTTGSDPTRVGIYRGNDLTATLVGQSASTLSASLTKPYTTYTLVAEVGQNLTFSRGDQIVFALAVGGTSTRFRSMTTLGDQQLAWYNTTDSEPSGFPTNPRSKSGAVGMFPAVTFVA